MHSKDQINRLGVGLTIWKTQKRQSIEVTADTLTHFPKFPNSGGDDHPQTAAAGLIAGYPWFTLET